MRKQSQSLISLQKPINDLSKILISVHENGKYMKKKGTYGVPNSRSRCAVGAILSERFGWSPLGDLDSEVLVEKLEDQYGDINVNLLITLNDETDLDFKQIALALDENWNREVDYKTFL